MGETNTVKSGIKAAPDLLRSAVVYGPNASGKSNLIEALRYMAALVRETATAIKPGETFNASPFRLDSESSAQSTEFEITFVLSGVRYQYGYAFTPRRFTHEYLLVYQAFKPQQWFKRSYNAANDLDSFEFGPGLKGTRSSWKEQTRPNSLFLSTAVQLNSDQLRPVFDWLVNQLIFINEISQLVPQFSIDMLRNPEGKRDILNFLTTADISIADIEVIASKKPVKTMHYDLSTDKAVVRNDEQELNELFFYHVTEKGKAKFGLNDESTGTRKLLFLAGPMIDILAHGRTLVIDELDTSLHPLLVRRLVDLFHNPTINPKGAQLIFSTHDTSLLDTDLFRRDQIWFVEKDQNQASKLYPLSDFSPRKNEALERGYLMGRYGALPFFRDWEAQN